MFENYREMSDAEKASVKAIHQAIRSDQSTSDRYRNLAWGFVRGFKFRRIERTHKIQQLASDAWCPTDELGYSRTETGRFFEHNMPSAAELTRVLAKHIPEFAADLVDKWRVKKGSRIEAWLMDPDGAIPVPVREKKPFVRAEVA